MRLAVNIESDGVFLMRKVLGGTLALAVGMAMAGCAEGGKIEEAGNGSIWPVGAVLETMDGGGYTYAHVVLEGAAIWVAGPVTPLEVGDTVTLVDTMFMGAFPIRALDRTFDSLYFVASFHEVEAIQAAPSAPPVVGGTAIQVLHVAGYTYVEVEIDDGSFWLAGPETNIPEGTSVQWKGPMVMRDFYSPSLDRTFSEIFFVDSIWVVTGADSGLPADGGSDQSRVPATDRGSASLAEGQAHQG